MLKISRRRVVNVVVLVVMGVGLLVRPGSPAMAQDRGSPPASAPANKPSGVNVGTTSGNDEADTADSKTGTPRVDDQGSFLGWMIRASGWIGLIIVLMSFYLIALIVWMAQHIARRSRCRPSL